MTSQLELLQHLLFILCFLVGNVHPVQPLLQYLQLLSPLPNLCLWMDRQYMSAGISLVGSVHQSDNTHQFKIAQKPM